MNHIISSYHIRRKAFTLVEMLMVVVIVGILLTISLQLGQSWKASAVSAQARQLAADFSQASLRAQKDNKPVEFRFYLLPDELGAGSATAARAFQVVRLTGYDTSKQPTYEELSEVKYFQDDIILHESDEYSSLLKNSVTPSKPNDPLIRGEQRSYVSFMFLPNGTTSLPRDKDAVFTLVKENELKNNPNQLPANYRSVILQPVTSNATVF